AGSTAGEGDVGLVIEPARRGWPGQARPRRWSLCREPAKGRSTTNAVRAKSRTLIARVCQPPSSQLTLPCRSKSRPGEPAAEPNQSTAARGARAARGTLGGKESRTGSILLLCPPKTAQGRRGNVTVGASTSILNGRRFKWRRRRSLLSRAR